MKLQDYKQFIDDAEVVSFDIFDTLLTRNVVEPKDVFILAREMFNQSSSFICMEDFLHERQNAEKNARLLYMDKVEISLADIYKCLGNLYGYTEEYCNELKKYELLAEEKILREDPSVTEIYQYAIQSKKTIAVVSDMYLPKEYVNKLLKKFGIKYDYLILSSEDQVAKFSGSAYVRLIDICGNKKIVHIGDNLGSDVSWPEKFGIQTIHVHRNVERASYEKDDKLRAIYGGNRFRYTQDTDYISIPNAQFNIISGIAINYAIQPTVTVDQAFGYAIFGPMLLGFVQWLHTLALQNNNDHIYFLARDGAIMRNAYELYYGKSAIENTYTIGSRRVLSFPAAYLTDFSVHGVGPLVGVRSVNVGETLRYYGVDVTTKAVQDVLQRTRLHLSDTVSPGQTADQLKAAILLLEPQLLATAKKEAVIVLEYLKHVGMVSAKKPLVVDIGWNGSMQESIINLTSKKVEAAYFGVHDSQQSRSLGDLINGYFDARKKNDAIEVEYGKKFLQGGVLLLESLFTNPKQGTIIGIQKKDNTYTPIEGEYDLSKEHRDHISEIHEAALKFISDYRDLELPNSLALITRENAFRAFDWMIDSPNDILAKMFGYTRHSDVVSSIPEYIGAPLYEINYYKTKENRKHLLQEYNSSIWKTGFLKNCEVLGIPSPIEE